MRSFTFMSLAPLAFTLVSAGCYHSGDKDVKGNKDTATNALDAVCNSIKGYYQPQQFRTGCGGVDTESTYWYFEVKMTGWGGTLSYDTCKTELAARFCDQGQGGSNEANGWYFRSDPGNGHCTDIGYINQNPNGKREEQARGEVTVYTGEHSIPHETIHTISTANGKTKRAADDKIEAPFQA
ncbi:hypothetical protein BDV96DRAFT_693815 [Lophiotrema nucula]|uniref:Necrosis-inducing factor-domain-containing protein n=1 Tax=Lophiotrema nucula TaxID=690887 RepID=A0A6A5YIW7_9PLEO|nr:hypothetical protein BDV96DRAFT_693815 [Lophiotrema nucula]